ncbi:hypothetical protein CR205_06520 [Alteribacter lacisalsi]|uniref:M50 family peptidase n=1 Tax=Alteribacter lacisalsi TaxID=2045244 RepID=A0A2W0HL35_9BACI|nr:M50 family metallopeptidase [Alteribacter lacisalsi]PYZ98245.1 hypothetical protein CR205_06520 [Alteribacter lacisalsi]
MITEYAVLFALVLLLSFVPVIGPYVKLFNTLVHEVIGHALIARLTGGRVSSVHLFHNTGGMARFHHHKAGRILTIFSGYPAASLVSAAYIYLYRSGYVLELAVFLVILLVISLLFWIRNLTGFFWVVSVLGGFFLLYRYEGEIYLSLIIMIIGVMMLIQAFASAIVVCLLSFSLTQHSGDAQFLAEETRIPAPVWGVIFALFATLCFAAGIFFWFSEDLTIVFNM